MSAHLPVEINHVTRQGVVRVTWDDGHVGDYPREYLRGYCPCALCQGHEAEIKFIAGPTAELAEITAVGNYAVQFRWEDGHSTGIYTFDYLRSLCPCPQCEALRSRPVGQRRVDSWLRKKKSMKSCRPVTTLRSP